MKNLNASALGKRSQEITRKKLGKKKYSERMRKVAQKRWENKVINKDKIDLSTALL
jgi:hypothetical protein